MAALLPRYLGLDKPGKHSGRLPLDWGGMQARTNSLEVHSRKITNFYVPASYIMYLSDFCRFLLCTCEWERRGERRAGEGEGARERG